MVAMVGIIGAGDPAGGPVLVGSAVAGALAAVIVIRTHARRTSIGTPGDDLPMSLGLRTPTTAAHAVADDRRPVAGRLAPRLAISY